MELSLKQLELSRAVSESIDLDKEVFINQFNLHDTRNCFKLLRSFGFSSLIPTALRNEKSVLYTDLEKAEGFNSYFGSVYRESPITALPSTVGAKNALLDNVNISVLSIEKYLASCADSTLMGNDLFPSFIARDCTSQLAPLVAVLFYWILKNQKWPTIWKTSIVTPLHKSGSTALISNYRPISILPVLSLVLERAIFDYLFPIVRPLIFRGQHGFISKRSTVSQLIEYLDLVYTPRDQNIPCLAIYFDIQKAFDTVPHDVLLNKLANVGLDLNFLTLICSYLSNGKQCVKINQTYSNTIPVTSDVPQGSVLGPLFFILFMNNLPLKILHGSCFLFADDLKIFTVASLERIQDDLDSINSWSLSNGLKFHPAKCKILPFNYSLSDELILGEVVLPTVDSVQDLGLLVCKSLSWNNHIQDKLAKCNKIFYFLERHIPFSTHVHRIKMLYQSLLLSVILYG